MSDSSLRWREHFATNPNLSSTNHDCFAIHGVLVAATPNPDVLSLSLATDLPIWLENLPTSLKLAADIQHDYPGIKVLYEDNPVNDGLTIRFVHEVLVTGLEDEASLFSAIRHRVRCAFLDFCNKHAEL